MRIILTSALAATMLLSACGNGSSGSSPFGWFGQSRAERAAAQEPTNPLIPRRSAFQRAEPVYDGVTLSQVLELSVERAAGGAIIRAKGLSATLGAYDVRLVPEETGEAQSSVLEYTLKARYSRTSRPPAPARSREITVATFVTDDALEGVRTIRVKAAENARSVRR